MQSSKRNGFKIFIQDGRPGIALRCNTWIALKTMIDARENALDKWAGLTARVDYNRVDFKLNGKLIESRALPQPFKFRTNAPLVIGYVGENVVREGIPHNAFRGTIRQVTVHRPNVSPADGLGKSVQ